MDLQVTHLRTLQAIARHGSFSRAAQALNLTQPAVSMQVRHLEHALGLPLLERVGKRAFPTRAGELLPGVEKEPSLPAEVTTPSLEAWRSYSAAMREFQAKAQSAETVSLLKRARLRPELAAAIVLVREITYPMAMLERSPIPSYYPYTGVNILNTSSQKQSRPSLDLQLKRLLTDHVCSG